MNRYILVVTLFSISKIHFFRFWFSFFSFCFHLPLLICHLCSIPWTQPAKTEANGKQRKPKPNRKKGTIFSIFQSLASPVFSNQNNVKCDQGSLRQLGQKSSLLGGQDRSSIFLQSHAVFDRIWQTQCVFSKIIKKLRGALNKCRAFLNRSLVEWLARLKNLKEKCCFCLVILYMLMYMHI